MTPLAETSGVQILDCGFPRVVLISVLFKDHDDFEVLSTLSGGTSEYGEFLEVMTHKIFEFVTCWCDDVRKMFSS